tara:strand:+ start:292 stop:1269 length:978 start_codon:yes stop_codon:yes gene_type:complete
MEGPIGISMILMGIYLFWEPSYGRVPEPTGKVAPRKSGMTSDVGAAVMASVKPNFVPRRGLRIYRAFGVVGALLGLLVGTEFAIPLLDSMDLFASGTLNPDAVKISCVVLGLFFGYTLPKVAENYIVVGGPPIAIVLGYEYLVYERGIDLQEVLSEVPIISELSHPSLSSLLLVSSTFLTLAFRMYLRQVVPIFMSGLLSGGLIGNGGQIVHSTSLPESPVEVEVAFSSVLALSSIALQIYSKFYRRDRRTKKERAQAQEKRMSQGKKTGDVIILRCPSCSQDAPHKVINRREGAQGIEVMVNCRGLNQFDEVCNFHHTVIEVSS